MEPTPTPVSVRSSGSFVETPQTSEDFLVPSKETQVLSYLNSSKSAPENGLVFVRILSGLPSLSTDLRLRLAELRARDAFLRDDLGAGDGGAHEEGECGRHRDAEQAT